MLTGAVEDEDREVGRLATETLDERRARLVVPPPPSRRRLAAIAALVVLVAVVGVGLGVVPGSSVVGRFPVWSLYELADRIDASNAAPPDCGTVNLTMPIAPAHVNLLTGRIEVDAVRLGLTPDEAAMLAEPAYAQVCVGPGLDDTGS